MQDIVGMKAIIHLIKLTIAYEAHVEMAHLIGTHALTRNEWLQYIRTKRMN